MSWQLRDSPSVEYLIDFSGQVLKGEPESIVEALMNGAQLVFRARWDPSVYDSDQALGLSIETYQCKMVFIAPQRGYFAGIIGPLYCCFSDHQGYHPLNHEGFPIYMFQASDSSGNNTVRHLHTHPKSAARPSQTGRYDPLAWLARDKYNLALHVDDNGKQYQYDLEQIKTAISEGRGLKLLLRRPFSEIITSREPDLDYWIGFDVDLPTYFLEEDLVAVNIQHGMLFTPQIPLNFENAIPLSVMLTSEGDMTGVLRTQQPTLVKPEPTKELGAEINIHYIADQFSVKEMKWFVEK